MQGRGKDGSGFPCDISGRSGIRACGRGVYGRKTEIPSGGCKAYRIFPRNLFFAGGGSGHVRLQRKAAVSPRCEPPLYQAAVSPRCGPTLC